MALRKKRPLPLQPARTNSLNLATSRVNRGISLEQIADGTKISIRFLRAIEDEEFEKLPGGIFNTSYLRQYAAATGFEEAALLEHYDRYLNPQPVSESGIVRPERSFWIAGSACLRRRRTNSSEFTEQHSGNQSPHRKTDEVCCDPAGRLKIGRRLKACPTEDFRVYQGRLHP